jgi:hypothetical protein
VEHHQPAPTIPPLPSASRHRYLLDSAGSIIQSETGGLQRDFNLQIALDIIRTMQPSAHGHSPPGSAV